MSKNVVLFAIMLAMGASAQQGNSLEGGELFAGEIILGGTTGVGSKPAPTNGASENKSSAISAREGAGIPPAAVVISPDEESGVLSPSAFGAPPDNRTKAKNFSRGVEASKALPSNKVHENSALGIEPPRSNAEKIAGKARHYLDGSSGTGTKPGTYVKLGTSVGVVGADGVVVFQCDNTSNTAGRIGDDGQPGNLLTIVIDGKMAKARCK